ncbi:MAG: hypothetical protein IAE83_04245 [Anaerolinea sp.]|nr:hypothetical protein [Anaerolinea sp.]MCC6974600.1 hypothetical protein [Anaerolineae bacterium]CAG0966797.1 hypothetical protein ANRL4_01003 [Anaerolineae bacterium]
MIKGFLSRGAALLVVVALISACQSAAVDDTAAKMMPALTGYNITDTQEIIDALSKAVAGAATAGGQIQVTGVVLAANEIAKCYQQAGAVQGRVYVNQENPLISGLTVIVNRNKLLDPATLLGCITPGGMRSMSPNSLQPCGFAYALPKDNNEFYIAFVATDESLCSALCSALEGCTAKRGM